ncbi:autotransporter outer membrane beta-barrel domain-containing protein [Rahnella woolbedingensis]|uniref:Autotransporter outer membrane beta-barrel domain-containing protein n=1 Tax=Rahnella woolbedingensis TaxID=1510574 RepID=A0A419N5E7_9GAMM|nr:autotransporter outer membrane beta-barrel domain-containing protein [Rahnella woolbedingensis]RJT41199.1 autotransporter outer membrane beta-barrel domain-containing protein [Rahnella woolbedingensis]
MRQKKICGSCGLLLCLACFSAHSQTSIPSASKTVVLHTLTPAESAFFVPAKNQMTATSGGTEILSGQFATDDSLGIGVMASDGNAHSNGVYATWYQNAKTQNGIYAGSWLQYSRMNASVEGEPLSSDNYDIRGFRGSLESGYRQPVWHGEEGDVFITPQAQLVLNGLSADVENNGAHISSGSDNNLLSRLGIKVSRDGVASDDSTSGKLFTTYVEANWLYNTDPASISFDNEKVREVGTTNVGEVKLGMEGKLNSNLDVWSNVGQQIGGEGYSDLSAVIGVNYQF